MIVSPQAREVMQVRDVAAGLSMSTAAGWNQTLTDWQLLLRLRRCFVLRDAGGVIIATSPVLPYPSSFGWIGMVLVHALFRDRAFAARLLQRAIDYLRLTGLTPMLDATPAGRSVYQRMRSADIEGVIRWRREPGEVRPRDGLVASPPAVVPASDDLAFGADRKAVLSALAQRAKGAVLRHGEAYAVRRRGRVAAHVGQAVCAEPGCVPALLDAAITGVAGPIIIDVPDRSLAAADHAAAAGFVPERMLTRMGWGDPFHSACPKTWGRSLDPNLAQGDASA